MKKSSLALAIGVLAIPLAAWALYKPVRVIAHYLSPRWFIEGMAYSLSGDPRRPLKKPWQRYRIQFEAWYRDVLPGRLWEEAGKL